MTKERKGLGLQKCEIINRAAHAILAWRMYNNTQSLWEKTLYNRYCRQHQRRLNQKVCFRIWKCIKKGWLTYKKNQRCTVYKGNRVKFFEDKWIPNYQSIRSYVEGPLNKGEDQLTNDTIHKQEHWNLGAISFMLPHDL